MSWQLKWNFFTFLSHYAEFVFWIIMNFLICIVSSTPVSWQLFPPCHPRDVIWLLFTSGKLTWTREIAKFGGWWRRLTKFLNSRERNSYEIIHFDMALICKMSIWILHINWMIKMTWEMRKRRKWNVRRIKIITRLRVEFAPRFRFWRRRIRNVGFAVYICCGWWRYEIFKFFLCCKSKELKYFIFFPFPAVEDFSRVPSSILRHDLIREDFLLGKFVCVAFSMTNSKDLKGKKILKPKIVCGPWFSVVCPFIVAPLSLQPKPQLFRQTEKNSRESRTQKDVFSICWISKFYTFSSGDRCGWEWNLLFHFPSFT